MLSFLTRKRRNRAASLLAVLYALCLTMPTAVLASNADTAPAHCLTEPAAGAGSNHVHHGDLDNSQTSRDHRDTGDANHDHASKCCGLFAVGGVMPTIDFVTVRLPLMSHVAPLLTADLSGQNSDRIERPPRTFPSL